MKTILFTNRYTGRPLEIVQKVVPDGFRIEMLPASATEDDFANAVAEVEYLLAGGRVRINEAVLDNAKKLRMIQRSGVGLDSLDLEALRRHGIPLYVNQGINAQSVAEHALLFMLASLRRLPIIHRNTVAGVWKKQEQGVQTFELHGKTVGLIGMGSIARKLCALLRPFEVRILYYDPFRLESKMEQELAVEFRELDGVLSESDIVSLHCPLTDANKKMMNAETIAKMKQGAILINTARGGLVDDEALFASLAEGRLSFAGIDVHESEPISADYPLKSLPNVILTPHIAGVTSDSFRSMMSEAMRNIALFNQGRLAEIEHCKYIAR